MKNLGTCWRKGHPRKRYIHIETQRAVYMAIMLEKYKKNDWTRTSREQNCGIRRANLGKAEDASTTMAAFSYAAGSLRDSWAERTLSLVHTDQRKEKAPPGLKEQHLPLQSSWTCLIVFFKISTEVVHSSSSDEAEFPQTLTSNTSQTVCPTDAAPSVICCGKCVW